MYYKRACDTIYKHARAYDYNYTHTEITYIYMAEVLQYFQKYRLK